MFININENQLTTLIDTSATRNFMLNAIIEKKDFSIKRKDESYNLKIIDDNKLSRVIYETKLLSTIIQRHHEKITFNVIDMINQNVVLGML